MFKRISGLWLVALASGFFTVAGATGAQSESASDTSITYTKVIVKKADPYDIDIEHPQFSGTPPAEVTNLNKWIAKMISPCSGEKNDNRDSYISGTLDVLKLTSALMVVRQSLESFCQGNAHPNNNFYDHFIDVKTGDAVDLWDLMPKPMRPNLIQRIVDAGDSLPEEDMCKEAYSVEALQSSWVVFRYKDDKSLTLEPAFPHVDQACIDLAVAEVSVAELKTFYPSDSPAMVILNAF